MPALVYSVISDDTAQTCSVRAIPYKLVPVGGGGVGKNYGVYY